MKTSIIRAGLLLAALVLAGCNETLEDISPKATKPLPEKLVQSMRAKGMSTTSPIMVRIFKEESVLEVWKQKDTGRYDLAASYDICKWSGKLGPKFTEGDRQAPEGFYTVRPHQMNPQSSYHLSFNIGFPNSYDAAHGRTGQHLMVHGACSSAGCYSMTDAQVEQIYAFARDAFRGGQTEFQIQAFPFRMTPENMARYRNDPNYEFWKMLKVGYDHFEITRVPPKVDVCGRQYVFNQMAVPGQAFSPTAACPATTQPEKLQVAYQSYQADYNAAFSAALGGGKVTTAAPTIAGTREAALVADWSRRRARGERVAAQPPSLDQQPQTQMAEQPSPDRLATSVAVVPTPAPEQQQAAAAPSQVAAPSKFSSLTSLLPLRREADTPQPQAVPAAPARPAEPQTETAAAPAEAAPVAPAAVRPAPFGGLRNKLGNLFGG
jgi:murein L,D-transpeptidase YafK